MIRSSLIWHLALLSGLANAGILVDDFQPRDLSQNRRIGGPSHFGAHSYVDAFGGGMLGGERDVDIRILFDSVFGGEVLAEYGESAGEETFNLGFQGFPNNSGVTSRATLQWDGAGDEVGNTGIDRELNAAGAGNRFFNEDVLGFDVYFRTPLMGNVPSVTVGMILRANGQILDDKPQAVVLSPGDHQLRFEFAAADLMATDSISLYVQGSASNGNPRWLGLQRVETIVPEPASILAFSIGGLALVFRRRILHR